MLVNWIGSQSMVIIVLLMYVLKNNAHMNPIKKIKLRMWISFVMFNNVLMCGFVFNRLDLLMLASLNGLLTIFYVMYLDYHPTKKRTY